MSDAEPEAFEGVNKYIFVILAGLLISPVLRYILYIPNLTNIDSFLWIITVIINMIAIPIAIVYSIIKIHKFKKSDIDKYFCRDIIFYISISLVITSGITLYYLANIYLLQFQEFIVIGNQASGTIDSPIHQRLRPYFNLLPMIVIGFVLPMSMLLGIIGVYSRRITHLQRQYIVQIKQRCKELKRFQSQLSDDIGNKKLNDSLATLDEAIDSVQIRDYVSFLSGYYRVERQRVFFLHCSNQHPEVARSTSGSRENNNPLQYIIEETLRTAERSLPDDEQKQIKKYLSDDEGKPPTVPELQAAMKVLHEWDIKRLTQFMQIERFLHILMFSFVFIFAAIPLISGVIGQPPTAVIEQPPTVSEESETVRVLSIFGVGVLGAWFSMVIGENLQQEKIISDDSLPDPTLMTEATIARLLTGGISAIVILNFFNPEQIFVGGLNEIAEFPLAFLAGFSELFVKNTIQKFEENLSFIPEESTQEEKSSGE